MLPEVRPGCGGANPAVEEKSGLSRTFEYKPRIPEDQFPKREDIVARFVSDVLILTLPVGRRLTSERHSSYQDS